MRHASAESYPVASLPAECFGVTDILGIVKICARHLEVFPVWSPF